MNTINIRFNNANRTFYSTAKKRVDEYFKNNKISRYGNHKMVIKTIFMLSLYFVPYTLLLCNVTTSFWIIALMYFIMGMGMSGIGLSIMHDANHGSYSKNQLVNKIMSYSLNLMGGHSTNWQLQHNTLHHTFTNIEGHDEDIDSLSFLRFSPHAEYKKIHRFQYLYAWFFYGLMTFMWILPKDFKQLLRYNKMGLLKTHRTTLAREMTILLASKLVYYIYMILIPILVMDVPVWYIIVGFCILHYTCGMVLALIFQPAHVIEETTFPLPNESGNMENDWAVHQLKTTANFAPKSRFFSWFVGGLNFQVEHHLFPNICHVHYKKVAEIIRETAKEFNLPYYSQKTFVRALISHGRLLKQLGMPPEQATA